MEFVWKNNILEHVGCPTQIAAWRSVLEKNGMGMIKVKLAVNNRYGQFSL